MLPYRIETLFQHDPWANWALVGVTVATSLALQFGLIPEATSAQYFVLSSEASPFAFVGYLFAHAGIAHLVGNMIFLWVFGNAVCATIGNLAYPVVYLGLGTFAGLIHQVVADTPVVGASGAITGIVGLAVAFYPVNRVNALLSLGFLTRTIRVPLWGLALYWTAWDIAGAWLDLENVAYGAHLGGTAAGVGIGLALLATERVQLTEFDHGSLLDFLLQRQPPHKVRPDAEKAFAHIQTAARALQASIAAEVETPPPQTKTKLQLRPGTKSTTRSEDTQHPPQSPWVPLARGADTRPRIQLGGGRPQVHNPAAPVLPGLAACAQSVNAWPAALPEGKYYYFDGDLRHGPTTRTYFLGLLSAMPNTSRWWFWVAGMKDWQRVSDLNQQSGSTARERRTETPATSLGTVG